MLRDLESVAPSASPLPKLETFPIVDLATWGQEEAKPMSFLISKFVPEREMTLISGDGGANKSTFGQQAATCIAAGIPLLGMDVLQANALYVTAEDDLSRLHWMQEHICKTVGISMPDLVGKLSLVSLRGRLGNELAVFDKQGQLHPTQTFAILRSTVSATGAKLLVLDNVAHLFAGNENDRGQVTAFVNLLYSLCVELGVTLLLVAHSNKSGASYSGSTAWINAVRSQLVLTRPDDSYDPDERMLRLGKANYSRMGEAVRFRWHQFALLRDEDFPDDKRAEFAAAAEAASDNAAFLACLKTRTEQRRAVSERRGPTFAPTEFAKMAEGRMVGKTRLEQAMERLFQIGAIEREVLWKGPDRKDVVGLRLTAGNGAGDGAATLCADAGDTFAATREEHTTPLKGDTGAAFEAAAPDTQDGE